MCFIFRGVLESQVCPSNSQVLRRHRARYPDDSSAPALRFVQSGPATVEMARAKQALAQDDLHYSTHVVSKYELRADVGLGWGDEISNYYVVEDMLKLDPAQLLYLFESVTGAPVTASSAVRCIGYDYESSMMGKVKRCGVVETFVGGLGDWFENNGETLVQTVDWVLEGRGEDSEEVKKEVKDGRGGVVRQDEISNE